MYFLANDKKVYSGMSPSGRLMFSKFETDNDSIQIAIFSNELEAVSCGNMIIREYRVNVSVHPLSKLESFLKGVQRKFFK